MYVVDNIFNRKNFVAKREVFSLSAYSCSQRFNIKVRPSDDRVMVVMMIAEDEKNIYTPIMMFNCVKNRLNYAV